MQSKNGGITKLENITTTNFKKEKEKKKCRNCQKTLPISTYFGFTNRTCLKCQRQKAKKRRLEKLQRQLERKSRLKERKANSTKVLKKKLDSVISLYVRLRASDSMGMATCITCGARKHYKELQAGHYVPRDSYSVRYDLRNIAVQCFKCNMKLPGCKAGNIVQYTKYLLNNYGTEWLKQLIADGEKIKQWTSEEIKEMIQKYNNLISNL